MNREIKFRAWSKNLKKMSSPFTLHGLVWNYDQEYFLKDAGASLEFDVLGDDVEIMQFTGLKDKNGKECYDGDLAIIDGNLCRVIFCAMFTCGWDFKIVKQMGCYNFKDICKSFNGIGCKDFKIIGNIHENPELLK